MISIELDLARILSNFPEFKVAILFGSRATGSATPQSDIDLALLADTPIDSARKLQLMETIGAQLGSPVDIVDLYHAAEPILGQVLKGKRLLGDNASYARLITRHVHNVADFLPLRRRILTERRDAWIH